MLCDMSSPARNLRKTKRSPLSCQKVPFRQHVDVDELSLESPLPTHSPHDHHTLDDLTHRAIIDDLRGHQKSMPKGCGISDAELLASMAQRLGTVERDFLKSKREVIEKNEYIRHLEAKLATMEASQSLDHEGQIKHMHKHCQALQAQVDEMEEFLNDYGMVWIGKSTSSHHHNIPSGSGGDGEGCDGEGSSDMWSPNNSLPVDRDSGVDFDLIIKNVKQLNILTGEGSSEVTRTPKGAQLKVLDPVPLTLYNNGLALYAGPFRPYSDPSTQQVIQDLTDGYFPSELQHRHPEGVPLMVRDQREVNFKQRQPSDFPGSGHLLGGDKGPSRLLPAGTELRSSPTPRGLRETSTLIGQRPLSMEQFMSKLPQSVIRGGRVLDIRAGIRETLGQGRTGVPKLKLVDTEVLVEMKSRLELAEDERPPTPSHLTTLRIKTEDGEQTYLLKMKCTETIGDIRTYIDKIRSSEGHSCDYILKTTFPSKTLDDLSATVTQCGLIPAATLYMTNSKPASI